MRPSVSLPLLEMSKNPFNVFTHQTFLMVHPVIFLAQLDMMRSFFENAVHDLLPVQPRSIGFGVVSFVGVNRFGVCRGHALKNVRLLRPAWADECLAYQLIFTVSADMSLIAIVTPRGRAGVTGLFVRRGSLGHRFRLRAFAAGLDNGGIDQRGALDDVALVFQLALKQPQQLLMQMAFDQPLTEAADRCFIGHRLMGAHLDKLLKA
jgi:hypothetical protein